MPALKLEVAPHILRMAQPFRIAGHEFDSWDSVRVTLTDGPAAGHGEGAAVYFLGETADQMCKDIEGVRAAIEGDLDRDRLRSILPAGGARNAVDAALWELQAARSGEPVWRLAGVREPEPIVTTFTLGADSADAMARAAVRYAQAQAIKVKVTGDLQLDIDRVRAIRAVRPDVWLGVDANQGFARRDLDAFISALVDARVSLLEQPLRRGEEAALEGLDSPVPIAGDESVLTLDDVRSAPGRFQVINIKLDKCGGLTEGLLMAAEARRLGLGVMVGTMPCTSLGTAPGFILGQVADIVDLDGPIALAEDAATGGLYRAGKVFVGREVWG